VCVCATDCPVSGAAGRANVGLCLYYAKLAGVVRL